MTATKALRAGKPTPFDRRCWALAKLGRLPPEIAGLMRADLADVERGIVMVEQWQFSNSNEMVQAALNEQAIIAVAPIGRTLADAQRAERISIPAVIDRDSGLVLQEAVYEPDHTTRISAVEVATKVVAAVRDKGPAVAVQVNNNNGGSNGNGNARSFEERVRAHREKQGLNVRHVVDSADDNESTDDDGDIIDGDADGDYEDDDAETLDTPAPLGQ